MAMMMMRRRRRRMTTMMIMMMMMIRMTMMKTMMRRRTAMMMKVMMMMMMTMAMNHHDWMIVIIMSMTTMPTSTPAALVAGRDERGAAAGWRDACGVDPALLGFLGLLAHWRERSGERRRLAGAAGPSSTYMAVRGTALSPPPFPLPLSELLEEEDGGVSVSPAWSEQQDIHDVPD